MLSRLAGDVASQSPTSEDMISTVAQMLISCDQLMERMSCFVSRTVDEERGEVKDVYKNKERCSRYCNISHHRNRLL